MDKKNVEDIYKLSPTQYGLLFNTLYTSESGIFLEQVVLQTLQSLDVSNYVLAWQKLVERHSILRTAFFWENLDEPLQVVMRQADLPVERQDWRELEQTEQHQRLGDFLTADRRRGVDFSIAPLMRLTLIRLDETTYTVVWTYHHILLDGWSVALLLDELSVWYKALRQNQSSSLPQPRPFRDYIAWLREKDRQAGQAFWRQKLDGFTSATPLCVDRAPGSLPNPQATFSQQEIVLSTEMTANAQAFCRRHHITVNTLVQAAWALLLSFYSGERDVAFGAIVHGRPTEISGFDTMVGLFVNTIPVKVSVLSQSSVLKWLGDLHAEFTALLQRGDCPLVQIQDWIGVSRSKPMFDYVLLDQSYSDVTKSDQNAGHELFEIAGYPLTLYLVLDDRLTLRIAYDTQRFDNAAVVRLLHHLHTLLTGMMANPRRSLAQLALLTPQETQTLLHDWNDTATPYLQTATLQRLFARQAAQTPQALAVVFGGERLTYAELNRRANQLAHHLRARGVGPEVRVALCVHRSPDMVVGLLGVLKAGGAYVPLDPAYPAQRLAFMLQDAQVELLLTQAELAPHLPPTDVPVLCLDQEWEVIARESAGDPDGVTEPDHLAYVIYTSGSTGQPKGVMVSQCALAQYTTAAINHFAITPQDRVLQFASISFDTAAEEIYPCLLGGARLVLRTDAMLASMAAFVQACATEGITVLDLPTAYWHAFTAEMEMNPLPFPPSLRLVILGGEAALPERLQIWQAHAPAHVRLVNTYGPTETTIVATTCTLADEDAPIGKPIANMQVYVLDAHLRPLPVGVPGELYIGGDDLARGYLNRPGLTAETFMPNPFPLPGGGGRRLYRTGDRVRYRPDGNLEFMGRMDQQVKVRGFRIELGEIETVLSQHPHVRDAAVAVHENVPGDKRLVAYVVPGEIHSNDLPGFLRERLPDYMVPAVFVPLDALPLTLSGKVDRRALPAPDGARPEYLDAFVPPETALEEKLAEIWIEVLQVERIGIFDDFFDLGGNSLLATQVIYEINKTLRMNLTVRALLEQATIADLAVLIEEILIEELKTA